MFSILAKKMSISLTLLCFHINFISNFCIYNYFILPFLTALSFMETTSDPALGSLMASAPTCSPVSNYQKQNKMEKKSTSCFKMLIFLFHTVQSWPLACTSPSASGWRDAPSGWHRDWSGRHNWERWLPTPETFPPWRWRGPGSPVPFPRLPLAGENAGRR